jgi:16S rRNA (guanine1516-N2)-methyltransferase
MKLYSQVDQQVQAQVWIQQLEDTGQSIEWMQVAEPFAARWLRQHPELSLLCDADGLWLAADGMRMQPDWVGQLPRLKRASIKQELVARACQLDQAPQLIDATAGLGHDGLLLAWLGANVTLVERHPVLWVLLCASHQQAQQHPVLQGICTRLHIVHAESADYLADHRADVVYLDPMFPVVESARHKVALVKKEMQLLHRLLHADGVDLGEGLLPLAQQAAKRVVVKRPRHAPPLAHQPPHHQWLGDACRFDAYFAAQGMM